MSEKIHIALAANHRYMPGLRATIVSIIRSSAAKDRLFFHIFSDGLTEDDISDLSGLVRRFGYEGALDFRVPDMKPIADKFGEFKGCHTTFIRLFFSEMLPELDWILWVDVDTLWFRDIADFWVLKDESVPLVWCRDMPSTQKWAKNTFEKWHPGFNEERYCCAGVSLMNLARFRKDGFIEKCLSFTASQGTLKNADQDVLNEVYGDESRIADDCWDMLRPSREAVKGVVLHCTGVGQHFNSVFTGKWPLYEIWFRFYHQIVLGEKGAQPCGLLLRMIFNIVGLVYPSRRLIELLFRGRPLETIDAVHMGWFSAWLRRKLRW